MDLIVRSASSLSECRRQKNSMLEMNKYEINVHHLKNWDLKAWIFKIKCLGTLQRV